MKERGILMSGPMVRAILEGRKTQTRRAIKAEIGVANGEWLKCQYGKPGDRLWVRETWAPCIGGPCEPSNPVLYRADQFEHYDELRWRPSIFMPRWASRITLEITGVRVERLQDLSESDALAEGIYAAKSGRLGGTKEVETWDGRNFFYHPDTHAARFDYSSLWDSINGKKHPWASNPWVWVIEFTRIQ